MIDPGFVALHADAMTILSGWDHAEPQQRVMRDEYLALLRQHPDAMSRSCRVGHLTASALVVDPDRTRTLLTLHPKAGRWFQLGGHCEAADASVRDAVRREAQEESGIAAVEVSAVPLRLDRHPVKCGEGMSVHYDLQYLAVVPADATAVMSHESDDLQWFAFDQPPPGLDGSVRALMQAAITHPA